MPQERHESLLASGALALPSNPLQNVLLQAFIEYVFPCTPVVDWQLMLDTVADQQGGNGQISLLLYHAVMASAIQYVALDHLLRAGYQTRQEAYVAMSRNAKLVYESGYETDNFVILQSLLMMNHSSEAPGGGQEWYRIDKAISIAQSLHLLQDQPDQAYSPDRLKLRRRIAWACYVLDHLSSFQSRCMPLLRKENFDIPELIKKDFDLQRASSVGRQLVPDCSFACDVEIQRNTAIIYISICQLCEGIGHVLAIQGKRNPRLKTETAMADIETKSRPEYLRRICAAEDILTLWKNTLPPECRFRRGIRQDVSDSNAQIAVQRCHLHMLYYSILAVLHQAHLCSSSEYDTKYAASQITQLASELHGLGLECYLPATGITCILIAMIVHISSTKRAAGLERHQAMKDFQSCQKVMMGLQEVHPGVALVNMSTLHVLNRFTFDGVLTPPAEGSETYTPHHSDGCLDPMGGILIPQTDEYQVT
ncbi:fungal specific transcription factor domain-containing protein [Aspergillus alliaceus]|uniref:fungal specific transcription factor domain-containing protein n=1 Tax=Petromyces alliaceus TaxID=209559 RepID=UPI0012A4B554|nr:uncharacterized protein BDW43DRAFT_308901 [Aspergillus alliaceus]KAB8236106.1 hypothetical protein BDW43DRAFT_308901 [Aspergillus alliaceus]